ncbi:hypothetical protein BT67DRAFT_292569 [Trichocladium antarcticum]|uniref:Uncharacterized protein n=1 Tax=Trichocladium antarcticum TaxID=1450529 RepID=A0AAN6ZE99_9PEZI|nr:hypothetical protein BT67DRAFT_292569 [Trichocladium antarcticum]
MCHVRTAWYGARMRPATRPLAGPTRAEWPGFFTCRHLTCILRCWHVANCRAGGRRQGHGCPARGPPARDYLDSGREITRRENRASGLRAFHSRLQPPTRSSHSFRLLARTGQARACPSGLPLMPAHGHEPRHHQSRLQHWDSSVAARCTAWLRPVPAAAFPAALVRDPARGKPHRHGPSPALGALLI